MISWSLTPKQLTALFPLNGKYMNIFDTITLLRAGYTKKEIEAMKAEEATMAEAATPEAVSPVDMPVMEEGVPAAPSSDQPAQPEDDRVKELEDQVRQLQAKIIQLSAVDTAPKAIDPIMDIANTLINGGKIE